MQYPWHDAPTTIPAVSELQARLGTKEVVRVFRQPRGKAGSCYWHVLDVVQRDGGELVQGWLVQWLPNVLVRAMHHGVWKTPSGVLTDVTATQAALPEAPGISTFLPDDRHQIDLSFPVLIENEYVPLIDAQVVRTYIEQYRVWNSFQRELADKAKAAGARWAPGVGLSGVAREQIEPAFKAIEAAARQMDSLEAEILRTHLVRP